MSNLLWLIAGGIAWLLLIYLGALVNIDRHKRRDKK
jgi:hypothetical protein